MTWAPFAPKSACRSAPFLSPPATHGFPGNVCLPAEHPHAPSCPCVCSDAGSCRTRPPCRRVLPSRVTDLEVGAPGLVNAAAQSRPRACPVPSLSCPVHWRSPSSWSCHGPETAAAIVVVTDSPCRLQSLEGSRNPSPWPAPQWCGAWTRVDAVGLECGRVFSGGETEERWPALTTVLPPPVLCWDAVLPAFRSCHVGTCSPRGKCILLNHWAGHVAML